MVEQPIDVSSDGVPVVPDGPDALTWVLTAARAAAGKSDEETVVLDVGRVLSIVGHFVVAAGRNPRQVRTIAEEVERKVFEAGGPKPLRTEGLDANEWVLLDYGDFVVHVFHVETRKFYELERLWRDVPRVAWREDGADAAEVEARNDNPRGTVRDEPEPSSEAVAD